MTLILLVVLWFPRLLRPDLSDVERDRLTQQGTDKLVAAENDRSNAQNSIRTTLLQGIAGVALLTGAYFAYRGLEASRLQLKATEDGQITTRYTEAVKQLGDKEHDDVRIGGIYALNRIALDSDRDLPTVVALLSAFVRRSAAVKTTAEERPPKGIPLSAHAPDVAIALEVLTALGGADLSYAHLDGAHLSYADLSGARLGGAKLDGADLSGADLINADLSGADLSNADLDGTNLDGAHLDGAKLDGAHLDGADLSGVKLRGPFEGGVYRGAHLRGAHLSGANLRHADLCNADLSGADLSNAHLHGADLSGADLNGSYPSNANLSGANLSGADLSRAWPNAANFSSANLRDANLTDAWVGAANLTYAVGVDLSGVRGIPQFLPNGSPGKPAGDRDHDEADDGTK